MIQNGKAQPESLDAALPPGQTQRVSPSHLSMLIDTNVLIPLEPTRPADVSDATPATFELHRLAMSVGAALSVHPVQLRDLEKDGDSERRLLRLQLATKYPEVPSAPLPTAELLRDVGSPALGSNDWVDAHLLAALKCHAVSFLVTHDLRLLRKARRLSVEERVISADEACALLRSRTITIPAPGPSIRFDHCHNLDLHDEIFEGFRLDYPEFDVWFENNCLAAYAGKSRPAIVATLPGKTGLAGLAILKTDAETDLPGSPVKTIKICSLKVASDALGLKLGELILSAVFRFAWQNSFCRLFVEVFPQHKELICLLDLLGFEDAGFRTERDELMLVKRLAPDHGEESTDRLAFHRKFGPYLISWENAQAFLVPIRPEFHARLFPELEAQQGLWEGQESCGNTLLKAYICTASTGQLSPGDVIAFYRSRDTKAITTLGVVEDTLRSTSWQEVREFAAKRTVFSEGDLRHMCSGPRGALAILFRHAPVVRKPLALVGPSPDPAKPRAVQSIARLTPKQLSWLKTQIQ